MTQPAIMEDLQKTEDSLAPVVDFQAFKNAKAAEKYTYNSANIAVVPYSSRYPHQCPCCPCHHPAPMWPAYPQYPWHFPQPFYPDWTYWPYQQPIYFGISNGSRIH